MFNIIACYEDNEITIKKDNSKKNLKDFKGLTTENIN